MFFLKVEKHCISFTPFFLSYKQLKAQKMQDSKSNPAFFVLLVIIRNVFSGFGQIDCSQFAIAMLNISLSVFISMQFL